MKKKMQKFDIAGFRRAIDEVGADPTKIAAQIGCSRGTVYKYLRSYPELMAAFEQKKGGQGESRTQHSKEAVIAAIQGSWGIKATIAKKLVCSRQTIENYIDLWPDLVPMIEDERANIVETAEGKLMDAVNGGDMRGIIFTLETLGKDRGWTKRTEVTGKDGESLLGISDETMRLIELLGLNPGDIGKHFGSMVKAMAAQRGIEN